MGEFPGRNGGQGLPPMAGAGKANGWMIISSQVSHMPSDKIPNLDAAVAALVAAVPLTVAVYQFGSSVSDQSTAASDLDLAVLTTGLIDPVVRFDCAQELSRLVGRDVDLVDLRAASPVMAMQVLATGRLLLECDSAARGAFEDRTFGAYARLNEERRGILERVRVEGSGYGPQT